MDEVFWGRIYAGFRFRHSLEADRQLGPVVAVKAGSPHRGRRWLSLPASLSLN